MFKNQNKHLNFIELTQRSLIAGTVFDQKQIYTFGKITKMVNGEVQKYILFRSIKLYLYLIQQFEI